MKHADTTEDKFATRVNQEAVSWKSISAAARAAGRHDLAVDPRPVLQFARSHFLFWAQPESHYCQDEWHLYRKPTRKEVQDTTQWLLKVPRILLYCENITQRQLATNAKLEILLSAKWDVVDGLLAGMLAAPLELVADDIRPSLLQAIADQFTARICSVSYPSRKFEEGEAYLLLEQQGLTLPFPNLENEYWKPAVQWDSGKFPSAPWKLFYEAASKELLVGKFPNQNAYGRENWPQSFNKNYSSDKSPFEQRFLGVEWTWLWGNL